MERELWRWITWGLKRLPRWCPRGGVYDNRAALAVALWAALHDRSVSWACRRDSWPVQAWRRRLPDQSTMSRRLRDPRVIGDLRALVHILQRRLDAGAGGTLLVDGKPLAVSRFSADSDARVGWGAGGHSIGYKLHALIDSLGRLLAWEVEPMNTAECVVARVLIEQAAAHGALPGGGVLLGDASYDSNHLHAAAHRRGLRLIAPRRKAGRSLSTSHRQHPGRLASIKLTEHDGRAAEHYMIERRGVERYFGTLATWGGGLFGLPAWARRLHRVRCWVAAKLVLNAARHVLRSPLVA
jgi:hypothetical protein